MLEWFQYMNNANKIKQSYINGFIDISGGDLINRHNDLYIGGNTLLNTNVRVNNDTVLSKNVYIYGDVSMNGKIVLPTGDLQSMLTNLFMYTTNLAIENGILQNEITVIDISFNQLYSDYQRLQTSMNYVQSRLNLINHIVSDFTHITISASYDLSSNIKYVVETDCSLNLPQNIEEGTTIIVANKSNNMIGINASELIYNVFYLPSGGNRLYVPVNVTSYITYVKNNTTNVNTWSAVVY
jgi:hypothetical protein